MTANNFPNLLTDIINKNSINGLISDYEMMINSQDYNNVKYKLKVQEYIDKIQLILNHIEDTLKQDKKFYEENKELIDKFKKSYDKNPYFVNIFKKKLINLLCMSTQFQYDGGDMTGGIVEDERKHQKGRKK
jgi:hypothetical protein